jgi:uridine kinase
MGVTTPPGGSPGALVADRDSYFAQMLERNCSVGKGRRVRGENGEILDTHAYASLVDERVERCGGGKEPFLIGVAGGTASGKTTVCDLIMHNLQEKRVVLIAQDSYYRGLTPEEHDNVSSYNFDHPDAIDVKSLVETLKALLLRNPVKVPVYDFVTHSRVEETIAVEPADVIIIEGILVLAMQEVRDLCHMKIFVDTDDDLRLARRLKRDTVDRGRSVDGVISQYTTFVKPMFDTFVSPSKKYADVIIPWAQGENTVAIDLIVQHIRTKLGQNDLRRIYPNLIVLPPNFQIRGMHTIIRSARCNRSDFVFYSDRLIRLVVEHALGHLPFKNESVRTPNGDAYDGVCFSKKICGVSIIRSGEAMENALRACCKGIKIGKLLIERRDRDGVPRSSGGTPMGGLAPSHANKLKRGAGGSGSGDSASPGGLAGLVANAANAASSPLGTSDDGDRDENDVRRVARESESEVNKRRSALAKDTQTNGGSLSGTVSPGSVPRVMYEKMPGDIAERYVLLLDPILATGVSSAAAIDRLLRLGVREDRIMFVTVIAASQGIHTLASKYPHMKIITSEVDAGLNEANRVVPGVGEFGDRYFGTEDMVAMYDFE